MPPRRRDSNSKRLGSSSSISLNESPTEETNYDSDISNDDNAVAEGEDEGDPDEGFELEVSTLTGNTFSVMIHPSDTVEVLKTRIAFQEGISPADQNLLLEQGKLLNASNTIQELNIDSHSKLTLVTNVASGVPYKAFHQDSNELQSSSSSSSKFAPTIRRNYQPDPSSTSSSYIRLPKILTSNNGNIPGGQQMHPGSHSRAPLERLDEREWMQSLFNKVVEPEAGQDSISMDSTRTTAAELGSTGRKRGRTIGSNLTEEDGSILVVQGDDGVILIIQKNSGQLLDDYSFESNNNCDNNNNTGLDVEFCNGRMPGIGKYRPNGTFTSGHNNNSYHSRRYYQDSKVHQKIKENAVTLEKMRQVRTLMAQKHRMEKTNVNVSGMPPRPHRPLEFPKITDSCSTSAGVSELRRDSSMSMSDYQRQFIYGRKENRSATSRASVRSINSSKMSLNRLIAEIYLQSKRKGHTFQPGQPPYTELQLMKYVQLKVAILQDEQTKGTTEPCLKCQKEEDWLFDETNYLIPTVVMNRYRRLTNTRNSKSLDKEMTAPEVKQASIRRPPLVQASKPCAIPTSGHPGLRGTTRARNQGGPVSRATSRFRKSSSSTECPVFPYVSGSGSTVELYDGPPPEDDDEDNLICDSKTNCDDSRQKHTYNGSHTNVVTTNTLPSFKVYSRGVTPSSNGFIVSRKSSCSGSSSKGGTGKKGVRCHTCRKKIGIACRYQCRCGMTFCSVHRYPEAHECTFDYKTEGRNKIRENNPVVVAPKIQEI